MTPEQRASLEHDLERLRIQRARTIDDREHDRLGRRMDAIANRLAAPDGFDTYTGFRQLDYLMRQPPR